MVVVMEERASEEQIQNIIAQLVEKGFDVHRSTGALRDGSRCRRWQSSLRHTAHRGDGGRARSGPDHGTVQARQPDVQARAHHGDVR